MKKDDEKKLFAEFRRRSLAARTRKNAEAVFAADVAAELGIHPKRAAYIFDKWTVAGLYDYGVNVCFGWLTEEAFTAEAEAAFRAAKE